MRLENQIKMIGLEIRTCKKQILLSCIIIFGLLFITFYLMLLSELSENTMYQPIQEYYKDGAALVLQDVSYEEMLEIQKLPVKNIYSYYFAQNEIQGTIISKLNINRNNKKNNSDDTIHYGFVFFYSNEEVNGQGLEKDFLISGRAWDLCDNEKSGNGFYNIWIDERLSKKLGTDIGDRVYFQEKYMGNIPCQIKGIYRQGSLEEQYLLPFCMGKEILDNSPYYSKCGMELEVTQLKSYAGIITDLEEKGIIVEKDSVLLSNLRTIILLGKMTWLVSCIMIVMTAVALRQCMNIIFFDRRRYIGSLHTLGMKTYNIGCVYAVFMEFIIVISFNLAAFFAYQKAGNTQKYREYLNEHTKYLSGKFAMYFIALEAIFLTLFFIEFKKRNQSKQIYEFSGLQKM